MVNNPELRAHSNIAPLAETTEVEARRGTQHVAPMAVVLTHEVCPVTGEILAAGMGRFARTFMADTPGIVAPGLSPEELIERWDAIVSDAESVAHSRATDSAKYRELLISRSGPDTPPG
jgi:hypothetical protein